MHYLFTVFLTALKLLIVVHVLSDCVVVYVCGPL